MNFDSPGQRTVKSGPFRAPAFPVESDADLEVETANVDHALAARGAIVTKDESVKPIGTRAAFVSSQQLHGSNLLICKSEQETS